ncbi:response regulator transcription factor [Rhizobium mesosinicum]|uniref:Response regulator transcription factor n=1 Tax=Rhizobium mesosinicum TaxID=335017 RepID=A0ABS7GPD7_9HYPH|nr:response regulator [Rhizobium mesosinicum]MBW9051099.1 response regulator transcription factor [Rhizobium mesosinicum]
MNDNAIQRKRAGTRRVLIVDDDRDIRIALEALLKSIGFDIETFASAEDLIERGNIEDAGCLVLDVRLTGQSGLSLQSHLLKHKFEIPIVFISGHADIPMAVRAIKSGAVEFLTKPVRSQDLIDAIHVAFARDEERRARVVASERTTTMYSTLTPRERDVMALIVEGHGNKQAAFLLGISEPTVKAHRGQVMRKMSVQTLPDLVRLADELGLGKRNERTPTIVGGDHTDIQ